ncbi:MAG: hypothetical protein ACFBSC_11950 [Microcoleaceae cyanobacterium]
MMRCPLRQLSELHKTLGEEQFVAIWWQAVEFGGSEEMLQQLLEAFQQREN